MINPTTSQPFSNYRILGYCFCERHAAMKKGPVWNQTKNHHLGIQTCLFQRNIFNQ